MTPTIRDLPLARIASVPLHEFLGTDGDILVRDRLHRSDGGCQGREANDFTAAFDLGVLYRLPDHSGFYVSPSRLDDARECLLVTGDPAGRMTAIGCYDRSGLHVDEAYRGIGLGAALAGAAMALGGVLRVDATVYSKAGLATFARAWARAARPA